MEEGVSKDKGAALQRFLSRNRAKSARREQRDGPASPALRWADADVDRSTPGGSPSPTRGDGRPESAYGAHQLHTVQSMAASNYGKLSDLDEHIRGALESHDTHRDLLAETMARMAKHNDRLKWESQRLQGDVRDKAAKTIQVWWRLYYHRLKEQRKIEKRLKSTWMQSVRRMTLPPAPPERPEFENDDGNALGDGEGDGGKKKGKKDKGKAGEHADDEAELAGADGKKKKKSKSKKGKGSKSGEMGADGANGDEGGEGAEGTNGIGAEGDSGADGKKKRKAKKAKRSGGAEGNEEHVSEEDGGKKKKKGKKRKQAGDGGDGHVEGDEHGSSDSSDSSSSSDSSGSSSSGDSSGSSSGGGSSDCSEPEAERGESKAAKRLPKAAKSKAGDVPAVGLDALSHSVAVASGSGRARAPSRSASARSARSGTSEVLEGNMAGGSLRGTLQAQPSMRRGGAYNPRDAIAAAAAASAAAAARRGGQGTGTRPLGDAGGFEGADASSPALLPFQGDARNIASTLRVVDPLTGAVLSGAAPIAGGASAGGYEPRTRTVSTSNLLPAAADSPLSRTRTLSHHETTCGGEHGPATAAGAGGAGAGGSPVRHGGSPIRRVKSFYGTTLPAGVESYLARSPRGQPSSGGVYGPSADGGGDGGRPADAAAAVQLQSGTSRSFGDGSSRRVLHLVGEAGGASGEVRTPLRKAITFHVAGLLPEDAGTEGAGHADGSADSGAAAAVAAREAMAHDTSQLPRSAAAAAGAGSGPGVSAFAPAASLPAVGSLDASAGATSPAAGGAADAFPEPALLVPRPASTSAPQLTFADDDLELPSHSGRAGVAAAIGNAAAAAGEQGSSLSPARSRRDSPPRDNSTRTAPCSPQREPSAAALSAAMQLEATAGSLTTTGVAPSAAAANATVGSPYASPFTSYGFGAPSQPGGDVVSVLRVTSLGAKSGFVLPSQSARGNASPLRRQGQSLHTSLASPLPGTGGSPARSQPGQRAALAAEASASCTSGALRRGEAVAGGPHLDREAGLNGQGAETAAPSEQGCGGGGGDGEEQWEAEGKGEGGVDYAKEGGEGALLAEASARSVGAADGDENGRGGAGLHAGGEPSSMSLKSQKSTGLLMGQRGTVAVSTAMAAKSWRSGADALRSVFTTAQVDPDVLIQRAMTPPRGVRGVPIASAHHSHQHHSYHNQQHQHQHGSAAAELYPRSNLAQHLNQLLHHPTKSLQQKLTGAAHPTHGHTSPPGRGPQHQQPAAGGRSYRRSSSPNRGADAPAAVCYGHYTPPGAAAGTGATAEADAAVSGPAVEPHYVVVTATAAANAAVADAVAAVALQSCLAVDDVGARGPQHAVAGMGEVQGVAGDGEQLAGAGSAAPPWQPPDHVQAGAAVLLPPGSASTPGTAVSIDDGMALGVMRQPEPTSSGLSFRGLAGGVEAGQDAADLVASAAQRLASVAEAARDPGDEFMALQPVGARVQPLLPRLDSGRGSPYTDANAAAAAAGAGGGGGSRPESAGLSLPALAQGASGAAGGAVSGESSTVSSPVRVSQLQLPGRVQPFPAPQHNEGASGAHSAHAAGTAPLSRHPPGWAAGPATAEVDSASLSAPPQLLSKAVSYGYGLRQQQQQQQGGGSPLPGLPAASPSGRSRLTSARLAPLATGVGGSPSASPSPSPSGAAAAAQRQGRPPHRLPAPHHHPDDAAHGLVKRSHTQALSTSAEHEEVDGAAEGGFASAPGSPAAYSAAARSHATPGAHLASPTCWSSAQTHHSHHGTGQHGHQHQAAAAAATSETDSPSQQHQPRRTADLGHSSGVGANADTEAAAALLPPPHVLGVTAPKTQAAALARGQGYVVGPHNVMSAVRASMYDDLLGAGGAGAGLGAGSWLTRYAAPVDPALNQPPSPRHHHHPHGYQYTGGHGAPDNHFIAQPPGAGAAEAGADQSLLLQEDPTSPPMHRRGPPDPGQEPASMQAASPTKPLLLHQLPYPHPQGQEQQLPRRSFERSLPPAAVSAWPASPGQPRMSGCLITDDGDGVYGSRSEQQFDWGYGPGQDSYAYEEYEEDEGQAASPQRGAGSRYGGSGSMAAVGGGTGAFGGSGGLPQVPPPPRLMTRLVVKRPAPVLRLPVVAASQAAALQQSLADRYGPISTSGVGGPGLGAPELSTASLPAAAFHTSMTASCDGVLRDRVAPSKIRTYSPGPFMMAPGSPPGLPSPVGGAGGAGAGAGGGPGGPLSAEPSRLAASASAALLGMEASGYSTVSSLGLGATGPLPPGAGSKAALKEWRALEKWWAAKGLDGAVVQFNKQAVPHKRSAYL